MNKALNEYLFTFMSKIKRFSSGSYPKSPLSIPDPNMNEKKSVHKTYIFAQLLEL